MKFSMNLRKVEMCLYWYFYISVLLLQTNVWDSWIRYSLSFKTLKLSVISKKRYEKQINQCFKI